MIIYAIITLARTLRANHRNKPAPVHHNLGNTMELPEYY